MDQEPQNAVEPRSYHTVAASGSFHVTENDDYHKLTGDHIHHVNECDDSCIGEQPRKIIHLEWRLKVVSHDMGNGMDISNIPSLIVDGRRVELPNSTDLFTS